MNPFKTVEAFHRESEQENKNEEVYGS